MTTGQLLLILLLVLVAAGIVALILGRGASRREGREADAEERAHQTERLEAAFADPRPGQRTPPQGDEGTTPRTDDAGAAVEEPSAPPVPEHAEPVPAHQVEAPETAPAEAETTLPMTRAERRRAREEAEARAEDAARVDEPAPSVAGAGGAAADGSTTWGAHPGEQTTAEDEERSARIASAADFRDEVEEEVSQPPGRGTGEGMSHSTPATDPGPRATDDVGDAGTTPSRSPEDLAGDAAAEAATPTGEWGGPPDSDPAGDTPEPTEGARLEDVEKEGTEAVILADTERFAATEPVLAGDAPSPDDAADEDREEPEHDWGAEEEALLAETRARGEALAADRQELQAEAEREHPTHEHEATTTEDVEPADQPEAGAEEASARRVSAFQEIRDGGYGVGSAAPIHDGAQPMDHPVAAYRDTMTYLAPGDPGYDDADPDVWFYDEGAAERSGFTRSDG